MKISVVCVKHGISRFNHEDVNKLYSMVKRNLTIDFDFFCLTDNPTNIRKEVICLENPVPWVEKQWVKETMFYPGTLPERMTLYFDLDVVIVRNIDKLIPKDDTLWCLAKNYSNYRDDYITLNGSVWAFNPKYWYNFFDYFKSQVDLKKMEMREEQEQPLLSKFHFYQKYKNVKVYPNEWLWSFKRGHSRIEPNRFERYIYQGWQIPENGLICDFHGAPGIRDVLSLGYIDQNAVSWIKEHWKEDD